MILLLQVSCSIYNTASEHSYIDFDCIKEVSEDSGKRLVSFSRYDDLIRPCRLISPVYVYKTVYRVTVETMALRAVVSIPARH